MDRAWDLMEELATKRGLHSLAWAMRYGCLSEKDLNNRREVKHRIANYERIDSLKQ